MNSVNSTASMIMCDLNCRIVNGGYASIMIISAINIPANTANAIFMAASLSYSLYVIKNCGLTALKLTLPSWLRMTNPSRSVSPIALWSVE